GLETLALRRPRARVLTTFVIWAALALPLALVTGRAQSLSAEGFESPLVRRPVVALDALERTSTLVTVALAVAALVLVTWAARRQRMAGAAAALFVAPLLPVLGL